MTKEELVNEIAFNTGFTKKDCLLFVDVFCGVVGEALERGERVKIVDFGVFETKEIKPRKGRDFNHNTTCQIPAKRVPAFIPGMGLKEMVGGAKSHGES